MAQSRQTADGQVDVFTAWRDQATTLSVFLVNGVRLEGQIIQVDHYTLVLRGVTGQLMIYKHAISTVTPVI